jgi:uncharacterized protein (UPF0276 family)
VFPSGPSSPRRATPIPAQAGIGLRAAHYGDFLHGRPRVGWIEAHSENYFVDGGPSHRALERAREHFPLSLHGVGLSLGSADAFDENHLKRLSALVGRYEPALVSEHLCWGSIDGRHLNDLLPLPYTEEALALMIARVSQTQDHLRRQILIENISSYLEFECSTIPEAEFMTTLATQSGCGVLLDVNNLYVNERNLGGNARAFVDSIPRHLVGEIHLAGHSINRYGGRDVLIDTHGTAVCDDVWSLYAYTIRRLGPRPTLIEWDTDVPDIGVLIAEADKANVLLEWAHDAAA